VPLNTLDLNRLARALGIPKYRGTFSKDRLPAVIWKDGECGIVNLEDFHAGRGSHWVAYSTLTKPPSYFDSFGDLPPPKSLTKYIDRPGIDYNFDKVQNDHQVLCGHLCLFFLYGLSKGWTYEKVLDEMK